VTGEAHNDATATADVNPFAPKFAGGKKG
jgi:hypothetical protein